MATTQAPPQRLFTVEQAALILGCSPWTVRTLIWRGDLPHLRVGRLLRVDLNDLNAWIEARKVTNGRV